MMLQKEVKTLRSIKKEAMMKKQGKRLAKARGKITWSRDEIIKEGGYFSVNCLHDKRRGKERLLLRVRSRGLIR